MRMKYFYLLCLLIIGGQASGQQLRGYEIGGMVGFSHYIGDLNSRTYNPSESGLALGVFGRYNISRFFSTRFGMNYGSVRADDRNALDEERMQRNLSFRSNIFEFNFMFEYNLTGYNANGSRRFFGAGSTKLSPYIFGGVALFYFNPKAKLGNTVYELYELETEAGKRYTRFQPSIPLGLGFKYNYKRFHTLALEIGFRKTFTDYIDDVSGFYADYDEVLQSQGQAAATLSDPSRSLGREFDYQKSLDVTRGNPDKLDQYLFVGISISKRITYKTQCLRMRF